MLQKQTVRHKLIVFGSTAGSDRQTRVVWFFDLAPLYDRNQTVIDTVFISAAMLGQLVQNKGFCVFQRLCSRSRAVIKH